MNRAGIRAVVEAVDRIPVVANGDIRTIADAADHIRGNRLRGDLDRPRRAGQSVLSSASSTPGAGRATRAPTRRSTNAST